MKEHFCPVEHAVISFDGECNWCGDKEMKTIQEMAREAGMTGLESSELLENFEAFAKLVREDEREKFGAVLRQLHDSYSLASDPSGLRARGDKHD
jgi:hypothetical protein